MGEDNQLRDIFELIVSYEKGNWNRFSLYAEKLGIDEAIVPQHYLNALDSAEGIVSPEVIPYCTIKNVTLATKK